MAKIKSYTTVEQSRELAEILPLESADVVWVYSAFEDDYFPHFLGFRKIVVGGKDIKAWSLAALLNYLREIDFFPEIEADEHGVTMSINYYDEEEARLLAPVHNIKVKAESFIDVCVAMIEKLHEQNIL